MTMGSVAGPTAAISYGTLQNGLPDGWRQRVYRLGDRVLIWSGNRPEWVVAFWGCLLRGVAVIPVDSSASPDLLRRIVKVAGPRGIVLGDDVHPPQDLPVAFTWRLAIIRAANARLQ